MSGADVTAGGADAQSQAQPEAAPVSIPTPPAIREAIELLDCALFELERASPEGVIDCIARAKRLLQTSTCTPSKRHERTRRRGGLQP